MMMNPYGQDQADDVRRAKCSPEACLKWAQSLNNLLQDQDGVNLFLNYLELEGKEHANLLHFWFACEGLKNHHRQMDKIERLVKLIYKMYFTKPILPINDKLRKQITRNIKNLQCLDMPVELLFDEAQTEIEELINLTTYPNFLKSDMYLQYLQSVQNPNSGTINDDNNETCSSNNTTINLATGINTLPTLHEDVELNFNNCMPILVTPGTGNVSTGYQTPNITIPTRLTKDMLLISQKHRAMDIRPKSESYVGLHNYRIAYNSYNPISEQDSERQSLSSHSDVRTESDNMSMADTIIDGRLRSTTTNSTNLKHKDLQRHTREMAALNKENDIYQAFIPRTQRLDPQTNTNYCLTMNLQQHAAILKEKLENLKRTQDNQELLERKLKDNDFYVGNTGGGVSGGVGGGGIDDTGLPPQQQQQHYIQSRALEKAIREKLLLDDDCPNDQDILDEHVSRVFSDLPTPSTMSPRAISPTQRQMARHYRNAHRKDRASGGGGGGGGGDVFSTFSGDSGNVHDYMEFKTKGGITSQLQQLPSDYGGAICRRSASKKTLTDLTDSGVSVVSDTPPINLTTNKDRIMNWLLESADGGASGGGGGVNIMGHAHSEITMRHRSSATSPIVTGKYRKGYGSRSNSLERCVVVGTPQPFGGSGSGGVGVDNMKVMVAPSPLNVTNQLDEARRRLEDDIRIKSKRSTKYDLSGQSTMRKYTKTTRTPSMNDDLLTTVVFSFCDEKFPYRTKIHGTQITLKQFKDVLPKKGNYRYFFKTVSEDLGNEVMNEEVTKDTEILPLWEGKIMAQVKPID